MYEPYGYTDIAYLRFDDSQRHSVCYPKPVALSGLHLHIQLHNNKESIYMSHTIAWLVLRIFLPNPVYLNHRRNDNDKSVLTLLGNPTNERLKWTK